MADVGDRVRRQPQHWGNGYATEACRALLRELFVDRSAHSVVGYGLLSDEWERAAVG